MQFNSDLWCVKAKEKKKKVICGKMFVGTLPNICCIKTKNCSKSGESPTYFTQYFETQQLSAQCWFFASDKK